MTDYSNANVNVPTGVELPNTLEFGCDHNGRANTGGGYYVGFNFSFSCNIPKFLCDNYTSFKITRPNTTTNFQAYVLRTDGSDSMLTVNRVYSIASYVVSSGELKILINNSANSIGEASVALYDVKITLIKS